MVGVTLKVEYEGLLKKLAALEKGVWLKPAIELATNRMRNYQLRHFIAQTDSDDIAWAPRKRMMVHGKIHALLRRTGRMRASLTGRHYHGIGWRVLMEVFTNVEYAPHHQFGAPRAHIPKREFLFLTPSERQGIVAVISGVYARALRGDGNA